MPKFSDEIDLFLIGKSAIRKIPLLILLSTIVGITVYFSLSLVTPRFSSTVKLVMGEYDSAFVQPVTINQTSAGLSISDELVKSQIEILLSSEIILAAMAKLGTYQKINGTVKTDSRTADSYGLAPEPKRLGSNYSKLYRIFRKNLSVERLNRSRVIAIEVSHADNVYAARAANAVAEAYVEWQRRTYIKKNQNASRWLGEEIPKLRKKVRDTENDIEVFREKIDLQNTGPERTLNTETLSDVNRQLIEARARKREVEARAELLKTLAEGNNELVLAPDILNTTLIQNLTNQRVQIRRRISELSATHLSGHPRIKQLNWDLKSINTQIRSEADKILKSLENEAQLAKVREQSLLDSLQSLKKRTAEISHNQVRLRALEREAKASRDLLESYMSRYREANTRHYDGSIPSDITIIEWAKIEDLPYFPKKILTSSAAMIATFLLSVVFAVSNQLLRASIYASGSHNHRFGHPERSAEDRRFAVMSNHGLEENNVGNYKPPENRRNFLKSSKLPEYSQSTADTVVTNQTEKIERTSSMPTDAMRESAADQIFSGERELNDQRSRQIPETNISDSEAQAYCDNPSLGRSGNDSIRGLSIADAVQRIYPMSRVLNGYRLLFTGLNNSIEINGGVLQVAKALSALEQRVILVDIGNSEFALTDLYGLGRSPGVCEVIRSEANIENVIRSVEFENFDLVATGLRKNRTGEDLFSNELSRLFTELELTYDIVLIHGETESARRLNAAIDCAIQSCICVVPNHFQEKQLIPARLSESLGLFNCDVELLPVQLT